MRLRVAAEASLAMLLTRSLIAPLAGVLKEKRFQRCRAALEKRAYPSYAPLPRSYHKRYVVGEERLNGQPVFTLAPRAGKKPLHIIYLHGGAYVFSLSALHWGVMRQLLEYTAASISVPIYPLAPENTHQAAFELLEAVYRRVLRDHEGDSIVLFGDSAGGGLALALAMRCRELGLPTPARVVLFSPWLDISLSNLAALEVERQDPVLGIAALRQCGAWWAGGADARDALLSPIYGDLSGLPPMDVFQGTEDILAADARLLEEKVHKAGGEIALHEYSGSFHDFVLVPFLSETKDVFSRITEALSSRAKSV